MSDELQAEIDRLKAENAELSKVVASLGDDLKEVRAEARDRRHENKSLSQQHAEAAADRDGWRTKAENDPEGLAAQLEAAHGILRSMKHERAFEKVAKAFNVTDPVKFADLIKLAGYTPDGDEPDEARITKTFEEALKERPYLVDAPAPGGATPAPGGATVATIPAEPGRPGPGNDRGQSLNSGSSQPAARPAGRL
jgi:hypothetical protein